MRQVVIIPSVRLYGYKEYFISILCELTPSTYTVQKSGIEISIGTAAVCDTHTHTKIPAGFSF